MKRPFSDYDLYVFDLDGTLYDQPSLRKIMATRLIKYYALHPFRFMDLYYIYKFRKVKDKWEDYSEKYSDIYNNDYITSVKIGSLDVKVCSLLAKGKDSKTEKLCELVYRWIYENPLTGLAKTCDLTLTGIISELRKSGKKVLIFSDYPVENKLSAMNIEVDGMYCATDEEIGEYKPSPKGLEFIMKEHRTDRDRILMIGDRMEKDGLCAANCGVDYLILKRNIKDRNYDLLQ